MSEMASQITSLMIVYSTVYSDTDQRKHQSSASLAIVRGINRGPVNSPHKWPVTRKMFPFDDIIMQLHDSTEFSQAYGVPGVLVTKPISSFPLFSQIYRFFKLGLPIEYSRSYLAGVTAA